MSENEQLFCGGKDIPIEEYLAIDAEHSSGVRAVVPPDGYPEAYHFSFTASHKMVQGSTIHCALLEPERFEADYGFYPGKVRRGKEYEAWLAETGKEALLKSEMQHIENVRLRLDSKPTIRKLLDSAELIEHSFFWLDPVTGLYCKCRPDLITKHGVKLDIKTTDGDIKPKAFQRTCENMGYYIQDSMHTIGVEQAAGMKIESSGALAVQSKPPYEMTIYMYDKEYKSMGRRQVRLGLDIIKRCKDSGEWPGMPEVQEITPSPWME